MAWLTYDDDSEVNEYPNYTFQRAAKIAKKEEFAVKIYERIIAYLEQRQSSAHTRDKLAWFYFDAYHDSEKSKALWYKVLNSGFYIDPRTGEEDASIASEARLGIADILYNEFRSTSDAQRKVELLNEMKEMQERRIRGWNDQNSLCLLAKVLACVGGLEREAQIAYSAQFSVIDPHVKHVDPNVSDPESESSDKEASVSGDAVPDTDGPGVTEQEASCGKAMADVGTGAVAGKPTAKAATTSPEWGDIAPGTTYFCGGENETIKGWTTRPVYLCLICVNMELCEKCYRSIQQYNKCGSGERWRTYCGNNHKYIRGPISGWKGVANGCMTIGEEKINFMAWLMELKEKKWKEAWKNFWMREEGTNDIL